MSTPATGITAIPVTDQPQRFSNGLKGTLLLINTDLNNEIWVSYGQAPAGSPSSANIPPLGNIAMPDTVAMWAVCDPGNTAMLSVVPGGSSFAPSAISIATQLLPLAIDIAEQIALTGIPLVANPVQLYDIPGSAGNAIMFGTNNASWQGQVSDGVNVGASGLASAIIYDTAATGTNGIPGSWPGDGGPFASGVTVPTVNFLPDIPSTLAGTNDAAIAHWLSGAPNGSRIMAYHECNLASNGLDPADVQDLDNYLIAKVHAANATLKYGRGLATSPVNNGHDPTPYITPGMDFYGMDGYQASNASKTPSSVFNTTLNAILAVQPNAAVHIIETGTALDVGAWFSAIESYALEKQLAGVQSYFGSSGSGQTQPFPGTPTVVATINTVAAQLAAAGTATQITAGSTITLAAQAPSPVAGYSLANGLSYDIVLNLTAGSGSTNPWCRIVLKWYDTDSGSALVVSEQEWLLPMGGSGGPGTNIRGVGPQRGQYLQITANNQDTVTCLIQAQVNSTSRMAGRDNWLWDANTSSSVPSYTLPPSGAGFSNCLGAANQVSVPAASGGNPGTKSWLLGLYAGQAYVRFGTNAASQVITVTMIPQPASLYGGAQMLDELLTGASVSSIGDFTAELILPRAPCVVTFSNSDSTAHNVSMMVTTGD